MRRQRYLLLACRTLIRLHTVFLADIPIDLQWSQLYSLLTKGAWGIESLVATVCGVSVINCILPHTRMLFTEPNQFNNSATITRSIAWKALCEDSGCAVALHTSKGVILAMNLMYCVQLRLTPDAVVGRSVFELYPSEMHRQFDKWLRAIAETHAAGLTKSQVMQYVVRGRHWTARGRAAVLDDGEVGFISSKSIATEPTPLDVLLARIQVLNDRARALDDLAHLSDRELEVAMLIAAGHSDSDIALDISRSLRTVHAHRRVLGRKLGVDRRHEIVRQFASRGLIALMA